MQNLFKTFEDKFGKLDIKNKAYALAVKDAVIYLYYDEDEKILKVDVEPVDHTAIDNGLSLDDVLYSK